MGLEQISILNYFHHSHKYAQVKLAIVLLKCSKSVYFAHFYVSNLFKKYFWVLEPSFVSHVHVSVAACHSDV